MKIPLNSAELIKQWGHLRFTIYSILALLLMLVFGYQIAGFVQGEAVNASLSDAATRALLKQENAQLRRQVSELEVASILASKSVAALKKNVEEQQQLSRALEEQLSFYQRVVAPEVTQDGFFIDGVQVSRSASDNRYRLKAVLLKQNNNKAMLKGALRITVRGALNGSPYEISTADSEYFSGGAVSWGFKYFQTLDLEFALPKGFIPEKLTFSTDVWQWKTKRGEYFNSLDWTDILDTPANSGSEDV